MSEQPRYGELRPRPQYGEYATPQDQAQAIAGSHPPLSEALTGHSIATPVEPPSSAVRPGMKPGVKPAAKPGVTPGAKRGTRLGALAGSKPRRWDIILTAMFIGYGGVNVISQLFLDSNLTSVLRQLYSTQGIGDYSPTPLATTLAIVLNVITAVLFFVTVLVTMAQLRRGRIAFYIPLIGGAIALIFAIIFVSVLLAGDPTFSAYINGMTR